MRDQLSGCRFVGTAVGNSSASGESSLNFSTCKREMQSARLFCKPETWLARNNMLYFKQLSTRSRIRIMTCLCLDVCLFIISTRATLSVKNKTQLFAMVAPQIWTARVIGKSSRKLKTLEKAVPCYRKRTIKPMLSKYRAVPL